MLRTRIITALVMMAILLAALFAVPRWSWGLFTLALLMAAAWEWSGFCGMPTAARSAWLAATAVIAALIFSAWLQDEIAGISFESIKFAGFALAALFWVLIAMPWLFRAWRPASPWPIALAGWLVVFPTWLALLSLREISPWLLLSFAAIVWVADIAAYFVGRRFGRRKLAPAISPGKTIEGAMGAVIGVVVYFFAWRYLIAHTPLKDESWVAALQSHGWVLFAVFVLLALFSIVGDLFESWMKRGAGLKDSSNLLPGHGGILDRIDALTSTLPLAGLYLMLMAGAQDA